MPPILDRVETHRLRLSGGELRDHPGCWKITGRIESESEEWSVIRKPDGTYWEVAGVHIFPPSGGTVRIDVGAQIVDEKIIAQCEAYYTQLQERMVQQAAE